MRIITSGVVVGVLILVLYLFWTHDGSLPDAAKDHYRKEKPIILQHSELSDFEDNRLTIRIRARTARVFENKKETLLSRIDGDIYSEDTAKKPTKLYADSGSIREHSKLITVWGDVRVVFSDGQKLYTERMNLDQAKELLYNEVAVRAVSETDKILADRMQYDIKAGILILERPKAWIDIQDFQ